MEKVLLSEMSWSEAEKAIAERKLVLAPLGANEVYGRHLPLGSDTIVALELSIRLARKIGAIVGPPIPVGESGTLACFPGTLSVSPEHFRQYLSDYCQAMVRHGVTHIFMVCGHLGNIPAVRAAAIEYMGQAAVGMVDVWRYLARVGREVVETDCFPEGHASEVGTSVLMALRPDLVNMAEAVRETPEKTYGDGPDCTVFRMYDRVSRSGVLGDPMKSSPEKGHKMMEIAEKRLIDVLTEFKKIDPADLGKSCFTL